MASPGIKLFKHCSWCLGLKHATPVRYASGSVKRHRKREERKQRVVQYQGIDTKPAERVYVWGHARTGALGVRSYLQPEGPKQTRVLEQFRPARLRFMDEHHLEVYDISCGYGFTLFAVRKNRKHFVMATGINTDSQLGYHEYPKKSGRVLDYIIQPVTVSIPHTDMHKEGARFVEQVACGRAHSLFLTQDGVYSQGNNAYGQCGRTAVEGEVFHKVSNIQKIEDLPSNITKVCSGQDHSLFLTQEGHVYSCGLGADGQTGLGTYQSVGKPTQLKGDIEGVNIVDIASKSDCVLALSDTGEVFGWGNSEYNQLRMVTTETQVNVPRHLPISKCGRVTKLSAGGSICALLNDQGHVYVWGYGILGQGPKVDSLLTPSQLPPPLFGYNELNRDIKVVDVKCGMSHFAAVTDQGDLYTWGNGKYGCLGIHEVTKQFFPLKVALPALVHTVDCGVDHTVALCRSFS